MANGLLLLVAGIWGFTFVTVQQAVSFLDPHAFNALRFSIGALFLMIWLLLFDRPQLQKWNKGSVTAGFILGLFLFIGYSFQTIGLVYTTSSKAGFITGLSVILVPLFLFMFYQAKLTTTNIIGVLSAASGLYLLTLADPVSVNIGDLYVFVCAVGFALQIIFTGKYASAYPTLLLTIIQLATVSILSFAASFLFENTANNFQLSVLYKKEVWSALLITSLFATALAFIIQTGVQKYTTSTKVALIFAMEPVFAAITAYFYNQERLSSSAWIGCILILAGMIFAELSFKKSIKLTKQKIKRLTE
ncbi:DMT family transporter [Niallia sp. NCCP-28]|uniref:DMT family transporter n=1 Tax=Niallia sp. NCCP-28 TaxID=2934712 RepID=UPI0020BD7563|nr:DMT family transporter [Niallia sp. NCCP-28]